MYIRFRKHSSIMNRLIDHALINVRLPELGLNTTAMIKHQLLIMHPNPHLYCVVLHFRLKFALIRDICQVC